MKRIKTILLVFLSLAVCLSMTACGKPVPGKNRIIDDIMANDSHFNGSGLKVTSFEITQRQTRERDMEDRVWVTLRAENQYGAYEASYELLYVLYNDGWKLEDCDRADYTVTPNTYPTEEELMQSVIDEGYTDVTVVNTVFGETTVGVAFTGYREGRWWDISRGCKFSLASGWSEPTGIAMTRPEW
ncbi:MAG: hypothetical protein Q4C10_09330 [Clostridia bacterium]|nr:hypothetical protein [Clostridia bacterium]